MSPKKRNISFANKFTFLCILLFSIACLNVCAENKTNKEKAQEHRDAVVEMAKSLVGKPYQYGAIGPSSFDCSGFVYYTFRTSIKKQLPRTATAIFSYCTEIKKSELEPGDLVFFKTTSSGKISHVGIYIGGGKFISAISDGSETGVLVRSLSDRYWKSKYCASGRVLPSTKDKNQDNSTSDDEQDSDDSDNSQDDSEKSDSKKTNDNSEGFVAWLKDGCTCNTEFGPCSLLWP